MKNKLINIFLILALVAGLSLLLYPTVSDYWNSLHASQAVASYDQAVKSMDEGKYDELLQRAGQYNRDLFLRGTLFALTDEEREDYNSQLDIDGSGVMGYIEIPTLQNNAHRHARPRVEPEIVGRETERRKKQQQAQCSAKLSPLTHGRFSSSKARRKPETADPPP